MSNILHSNEIIFVASTIVIYYLASELQSRLKFLLLHPVLVSVGVIISVLIFCKVDFPTYHEGGRYIEFLLKPAVVCLAFPLYQQWQRIQKQAFIILLSQIVGCLVGIISVIAIAYFMGAPMSVIASLAPKSASSPIAIEVSKTIGGIPSLTASVAISVGVFGAVFGYKILELCGIKNPISMSLAMGNASHAIGTAKSFGISKNYGVLATIGLIINGALTALITPLLMYWFFGGN
jgi:predicted murein hydrolase (TIGR00659 family)